MIPGKKYKDANNLPDNGIWGWYLTGVIMWVTFFFLLVHFFGVGALVAFAIGTAVAVIGRIRHKT